MGLFDFLSSKKDSGQDAGNAFSLNGPDQEAIKGQLMKFLNREADPNVTGKGASDYATNQVANNSILGQAFGKGGTLDRTNAEEQDLAKRGYTLKPEDHEAYGQASDSIAREFGAAGGSLGQALSDRGLSSSGVAGSAFSGLQGNKLEQLGQVQRQIANDRMKMNMDRLGQTRSFLSNLTGQAQGAIQNQWGRNFSGEQQNFNEESAKNNAANQRLAEQQDQENEKLQQRQQTQQQQGWAAALQGVGNTAQQAAMAYATGGMGGGGIFDKPQKFNTQTGAAMYDSQTGKQYTSG